MALGNGGGLTSTTEDTGKTLEIGPFVFPASSVVSRIQENGLIFRNTIYFFGGAFFLPKPVSTVAPMLASICLAASA